VRLLRAVDRLSGFAFLERALAAWAGTGRAAALLRRAGVERTVGEYVLASAAAAALGLALGTQAAGAAGGPPSRRCSGGAHPDPAAAGRAARRRVRGAAARGARRRGQLAQGGYSFPAALEFASGEVPAPLGPELARVRDEQRLGVEARTALQALADRVNTSDVRIFVTAVLVQRDTGGNLAELLDDLSRLTRDRAAFRGRVAALTAEPRISALVLAALPVVLFAAMWVLNRSYIEPMVTQPLGRLLLAGAGALTVGGYLVMRKLGDVQL
jgi:tight adherence protein B